VFLIILVILIAAQTPIGPSAAADYLTVLGWEVDKKPIETEIVNLPFEFDDVYAEYNKLQRQAGFDLSGYMGKKVTRYTFAVKNFEGQTGVRANVLMYNGRVIGGDLMTVAIDGFMIPLKKR